MSNQEECGICLDTLTSAVELPCRHKFCSDCLERWRPKYAIATNIGENMDMDNRCCPLCREKIPPSKEMITQLNFLRTLKCEMEARGETNTPDYAYSSKFLEELERKIGDWDGNVVHDKEESMTLPRHIYDAARDGNIRQVLRWLGPQPVERKRLNAGELGLNMTLLHSISMTNNPAFLSILLQLGADVNSQSASGMSVLASTDHYPQARLLLEWGGEIRFSVLSETNGDILTKDDITQLYLAQGNIKLSNLVKSELGGRRCEVANLPNHPHLNGKTCVVEKFFPEKSKYKIIFEGSGNAALVGPDNLKRRDRTPEDCGYYISFDDGKFVRRDFATKEECQAYVATLVEDTNSSNAIADQQSANDVAEKLATLNIRGDGGSTKSKKKKGKKGSKKKGRKA